MPVAIALVIAADTAAAVVSVIVRPLDAALQMQPAFHTINKDVR